MSNAEQTSPSAPRHLIRSFFSSHGWPWLFLVLICQGLSAATTPLPSGAVSWWKAENNANDSVGSSPGTMLNGATYTAGKVGQAFTFTGGPSYLRVPAPFRSFGTQITVEYWIKVFPSPLGSGLGQGTEGVDNMGANVWLMHVNGNNSLSWLVNDSGAWRSVSTPSLPIGGWHHVAGVADSANTRIYLDGVLVGQGPGITSGIRFNPSSVIEMGNDVRFPTSRPFQGALDEVTIYDRALTGTEIQAIYNAGSEFLISRGGA